MYLSGHTQQEIADAVGVDKATVNRRLEECCNLDKCPKSNKIAALFEDDFKAPLYNVWRFTKSSNNVAHFGESEQTIVENLLYLYTAPFDLVVDPFANGGNSGRVFVPKRWAGRRVKIVLMEPLEEGDPDA